MLDAVYQIEPAATASTLILAGTPSLDAIEHRESLRDYVITKAESEWHWQYLTRLYNAWEEANERWFGNQLVVPYIDFAHPSNPRAYGQTNSISSFGGRCEICIRPSF